MNISGIFGIFFFLSNFLLQWVPGVLSCGVKQAPHEADHPPPSSAKVKNERSYAPTSPCAFMVSSGTALSLLLLLFSYECVCVCIYRIFRYITRALSIQKRSKFVKN